MMDWRTFRISYQPPARAGSRIERTDRIMPRLTPVQSRIWWWSCRYVEKCLDWLVSSLEFPDKPVALINTSKRATLADAHLRLILTTMSARLVETASITLPLLGRNLDADGIVSDYVLSEQVRAALDCFAQAIAANG
jgi:hypothetical protein